MSFDPSALDGGLLTLIPNRTGASGYIGGDVLHLLKTAHPEYECSVLLRDSGKAAAISKVFPDVRVVLGDLDAAALIEEEASKADVIISKSIPLIKEDRTLIMYRCC